MGVSDSSRLSVDGWGPGQPWQHPEGDRRETTLFGGLLADGRPERAPVVQVLRSAVAMVSGWVGVEVTWSTFVDFAGQQPEENRNGIDWDVVAERGESASEIMLTGLCSALVDAPDHPKLVIAEVVAELPTRWGADGRSGPTSVRLSVQRWAMYGSGQDLPWFAAPLEEWMVDSAVALGAETGYVSLDTARAGDYRSAWELRACWDTERDPGRELWGYGWGTLLSPAHRDRAGGAGRLRAVPGARLRDVPGDRTWLTVGPDPAQAPDAAMRALHEVLRPALPPVNEARAAALVASRPAAAPPWSTSSGAPSALEIRQRWDADAEAAHAAGRGPGPWGPVGFTLDAGVPEVVGPFATFSGPALDLVGFRGLGAQPAAVLLDRLGAEALGESSGPGPSLRAALLSAVAHPGVVLLTGYVVGPAREDERVTVDGAHVVGDPVLEGLGAADRALAWQRVVELGLDAPTEPDELRPPSDEDGMPDGVPGGWTVWWD